MHVTVRIPSAFRRFSNGEPVIEIDADTVGAALSGLASVHPELGTNMLGTDGKPRSFIRVFLNAKDCGRQNADAMALQRGDTISIITAFSGG